MDNNDDISTEKKNPQQKENGDIRSEEIEISSVPYFESAENEKAKECNNSILDLPNISNIYREQYKEIKEFNSGNVEQKNTKPRRSRKERGKNII